MARTLTKKEEGFVRDYVKTGNGTKAVLNNYNVTNNNSAAVEASRTLRKAKIQKAIMSIADTIPDKLLTRVHLQGLNASDEVITPDGKVVASKPDYSTRHKYLDTAYKLKKLYDETETTKVTNFIFGNSFEQNNESY